MISHQDWPYWLAIGAGGAAGAVLRGIVFQLLEAIPRAQGPGAWGSYGEARATLAVNVLGSLLLGCLLGLPHEGLTDDLRHPMQLFWITGVCGAFTTFSTLCADVIALTTTGERTRGVGVLTANVLLGIPALLLGRALTS
jgi:CrcB protein